MVASELFSSLAAPVFAAMLFIFFLKRRSREINGGGANNNAAANDGTAGGDSGTHASTELPEVATSSGANKDAAANDGTAGGDSGTHTSTEVPEMPTSSGFDYEVFLSFRGPDTRATFTDHLYTRLKDAGIRTFKDDESLRKGEEFAPKLLQAIKQSKILIPIFSKDYATSVWCLKEVVQMVECQKTGRQKIIPIFYDVAPAEVRHQTGVYGEALHSHEGKKRCDQRTIQEWKDALRAVGEINGHDLQSMPNRREGEFVKTFTQKVFNELKKASLAVSNYLVGVDNQVDEIMEMIGAGTSETRIIGIHGMGGIGKTTIAKIIFNKFLHDFENCCFLSDIRETSKRHGIEHLQNQLISKILKTECMDIKGIDEGTQTIEDRLLDKKVLLLLDDVEECNHIEAFVGKRNWLGRGSKVIITTRNKDILEIPEVNCRYELSCLDDNQSLRLFSKHAFRKDYPMDEDIDQSMRAIRIAGGLPLTLEVIGSLLCRTKKEKWNLTLKKLENVPQATVQSKLKISYDALEVRQQHMFLDIACFFVGYDKDILIHFWNESKYPEETMEILQNMSLIKIIKDNEVWMHDQLRDLGRDIVHQKSEMKIEKQSRVWDPKEGLDLLRIHKGKKEVEALCLKLDNRWKYRFTYEGFESLSNLRFLEVGGSMENFCAEDRLLWHESTSNVPPANENSDLLPHLRWLSWHSIPPTFNITNFSMEDAVYFDLSSSEITDDWKGWRHMEVMKNLKILNLTECNSLERTPIFSAEVNLERLILKGCTSLTEIDRSICQLKSLVSLDVSYCKNLRRLPDELGGDLVSLEYLSLKYCTSLERLPDTIGNLESLIELDIFGTGIKELPDSIGKLKNLKVANMPVHVMSKIPAAFWTIEKLEEIDVAFAYRFPVEVEIGNCIYKNRSLRILKLKYARIYVVPSLPESLITLQLDGLYMDMLPDLSNLTNLKELMLWFRRHDDGGESNGPVEEYPMPWWIGNLSKLETLDLFYCYFVTHFPTDFSSLLPRLQKLQLRCPNLCCLPSLPSTLLSFDLGSEHMTALPTNCRSLLPRLQKLRLRCPNLRCLPSLPSSLLSLYLDSEHMTALPTDISSLLPRLETLQLNGPNLCCLPSLPSSLSFLQLNNCKSFGSLGDLSNLKNLSDLRIIDSVISEIRGLDGSGNLDLQLSELQQVGILPDLSYLNQLRHLYVDHCSNLVEIQGELPQCLEDLMICGCGSLQKLPDLSSLRGLRSVAISNCRKLNVEAISSLCSEKAVRFFGDRDESVV